jgi:uncharacterized protein YecE (DUF72 family)
VRTGRGGVVRIGCSGWNYAHWRGVVYPRGMAASRWLEYYATLFDTVEINTTFYRLPSSSAVAGWVEDTPSGFTFAVKESRFLTHMKRLTDMESGTRRFYDRIEPLVDSPKLGPVLWQLPPNFHRNDERLAEALDALPAGRHAFEFRHPSWFADAVYDSSRRTSGLPISSSSASITAAATEAIRTSSSAGGPGGSRSGGSAATSSPTSTTTGPATPSRTGSG